MNIKNLSFLLVSCSFLSACLGGSGYMIGNWTSNKTVTLEDYENLTLPRDSSELGQLTRQNLKELVGEYEVVYSKGNMVYSIDRVSFHVTDNKAYGLTYMNKRTIPSYKVEFSSCSATPEDADQSESLDIRYIGQPNIKCYSMNREFSRMQLGRTTPQTVAKFQREGMFTALIAETFGDDKYIPVTAPYVMKITIWGDAGSAPILGLRKIQ